MFLKILLLVLFFGVMVGVGLYCRRNATDVSGFVLGGRSVGPWLTAFAYGTSYFSAVIFVGYAGQFGWKYGIASTWVGLGNAFIGSLLAWSILGRRTRIMTQHLNSSTMPEFFGARFDSRALKVGASVITFLFLIPYTASLYNGLSRLFEMAFGMSYTVCIVVMALLTGIYVIAGGYMATAINDFIQGIIMLFGIVAVIAVVLGTQGGLTEAFHKMQDATPTQHDMANPLYADFRPGDFASWFGPNPMSLLGVVILTSLGTWGLPQMVGKFYSITDEGAIRRGTIISTLFAFVVAGGCYFLGGFGRLFGEPVWNEARHSYKFDDIIPTMLDTAVSSDLLIGMVMVLVLSASMSTLASLVLTSSSTMTLDLIYRDKKSQPGEVEEGSIDDVVAEKVERRKVVIMRVLIVFFIVISVLIALNPPTFIAQLMGISWGALAGAFLAPFMLGLYWRGVTTASVWACFVWGVGITVVNMLAGNPINPINCGAIAMVGGFPVVLIVSLLTKKMNPATVDGIFDCYK